jgi:hypothetical protein
MTLPSAFIAIRMAKLIIILIIVIAALMVLVTPYAPKSNHPHLHAGFQVYRNNVMADFSQIKYMHLDACGERTHLESENEQMEKAHLHNQVGDVVHVHRNEVVWGDLFNNLNYLLDSTATAYINDQIIAEIEVYPIYANDSLVLFEGENEDIESKLSEAVTINRILEVESMVESCGR